MNPSSSSLFSTFSKWKSDLLFESDDNDDDEHNSYKRPKNDVFLNYAFEDVGKTFVSHLRGALIRNSFTVSDHTMLPVGQDTRLELLKAIEESEIYVLVFSPSYASSIRSLDELVDIMDCFHRLDGRKVLPVFFNVEPSHVGSQQGPYMEAFQAHETSVNPERVQVWRQAMKYVRQLSGHPFQNGNEAKFVSEIVEVLEKMQRPHELHVTDHPVGIGSRAEEIISALRLDWKDGVLVVAVLGISGIGKTTIVKEVFNRIALSFDLSCFLADIHDICQAPNWKVKLQKKLISCLSHENKFSNHNEGVTKIRRLIRHQKVLLALDGVDHFQQLESLGISPEWFHEGSRIIVTTRDKGSLGGMQHVPYRTMLLNRRESLNLFTRLMFGRDDPVNTKFIEEVVGSAGGLPLVLKVWSRHFKQYGREQWPSILQTLKRIPHGDVQKQLQLSYDSLTKASKSLFLDIACFYNDDQTSDMYIVVDVLQDEELAYFPNNDIQILLNKSLVEIASGDHLRMQHVIREMAYEIVRQENEDEPGKRTRLFDQRDVERVLTEYSGTESVESIRVKSFNNMQKVSLEAFRKMSNLRLIHVRGDDYSPSDEITHDLCFKKLKYMYWYRFPLKSLDNIDMCNVVVLDLQFSKLETLWEGIKSLKKLRILDVSYSRWLTKTGNLSGLENLEELSFHGCVNLKELHCSIGDLQKLYILKLSSSIPFKRIPWEMIGKLVSLQKLVLSHLEFNEVNDRLLCSLKECPIITLVLDNCNISKISCGVASLACLKNLYLYKINTASNLDSLLQLHELKKIELYKCNSLQSIPNLPRNITSVIARSCSSLANLPCNISELKSLTLLHLKNCPKLGTEDPYFLVKVTGLTNLIHLRIYHCSVSQVPSEIGNLVSLEELNLSSNTFSSLPDSLSNLSQLVYLNIEYCRQLRLLPLLPSNLTKIHALFCDSLDLTPSASIRTKVCKESPFGNRCIIRLSQKMVPDWCMFQSKGDNLSFVAPMHSGIICGVILCAEASKYLDSDIVPQMHNKTQNTSHRFVRKSTRPLFPETMSIHSMQVMCYPLDDTTLVVEPGDSVVLKFPQGLFSRCGLRLIYESDVVDSKLFIQSVNEPFPFGDSCFADEDELR